MDHITCIICGSEKQKPLFQKASGKGDMFHLVKCAGCGLEYVDPRPDIDAMNVYYEKEYFTKRTDRGYNDYLSDEIRNEIFRVMELNCRDLGFYNFEYSLGNGKRSLDIGCAAGYFVQFMKQRGWDSHGIDVSAHCINYGVKNNLNILLGDYCKVSYDKKFQLISLWATIEHLHHPDRVLEKAFCDLDEGGVLYLSTCRTGGINFKHLFGKNWRYYNFPEHLYFFSYSTIKRLLRQKGFAIISYKTYGSGVGTGGSFLKRVADFGAKKLFMGDMMLIAAKKV